MRVARRAGIRAASRRRLSWPEMTITCIIPYRSIRSRRGVRRRVRLFDGMRRFYRKQPEGNMFKSNAVRSCVELHEIELRRFLEVWRAFRASGITLPSTEDPSYKSNDHLAGHVLRSARGYLTWIGECVNRPVTDLDSETDPVRIAARGPAFLEDVLAGWRRHLAVLEDRELAPVTYKSRWGEDYDIEQMLEHAVVHPMRHRIQLERLMAAALQR
jgi:hypothetical protein